MLHILTLHFHWNFLIGLRFRWRRAEIYPVSKGLNRNQTRNGLADGPITKDHGNTIRCHVWALLPIRFSAATQWPVFKDNAYRKFITFAVDNARESKTKCVYKAKRNDTRLKAPAELPFSPTPTPPSAAKEYPPSSFSSETPTQGRLILRGEVQQS